MKIPFVPHRTFMAFLLLLSCAVTYAQKKPNSFTFMLMTWVMASWALMDSKRSKRRF